MQNKSQFLLIRKEKHFTSVIGYVETTTHYPAHCLALSTSYFMTRARQARDLTRVISGSLAAFNVCFYPGIRDSHLSMRREGLSVYIYMYTYNNLNRAPERIHLSFTDEDF